MASYKLKNHIIHFELQKQKYIYFTIYYKVHRNKCLNSKKIAGFGLPFQKRFAGLSQRK